MKSIVLKRSIILYLLFAGILIAVVASKKNLHVDEVLTYGLSNYHDVNITPVDGKTYNPSESFFFDYVTVGEKTRFQYEYVWKNQIRDTHPPMYYALVHTISSFFPGKYSIWYAGAINILFALLTFWAVRGLVCELTKNENAVILASIFFMFSAGILSAVSFFRMYVMAMSEVTLVTLLFVRAVKRENYANTWKFYFSLIAMSVFGALTHYYFIVYLFFLCLIYGVYLLSSRRVREMGFFILSMSVSGGLSVAVFPGMIKHMFLEDGHRGQESRENLMQSSLGVYLERLEDFYSFINEQIFGNALTYIIVACLVFVVFYRWNKLGGGGKWKEDIVFLRHITIDWVLVTIPSICYFLLISKMAVYVTDRYLMPVYAVIVAVIITIIYCIGEKLDKKKHYFFLSVLTGIMIVNSWKVCGWAYLYKNSPAMMEKAAEYQDVNDICIYESAWKSYPSFYELSQYKSITFYHKDNLDAFNSFSGRNDSSLIVTIENSFNAESILNKILGACPMLDSYEKIATYGYMSSYYLYPKNLMIKQYRIYDYNHSKLVGCDEAVVEGNICTTVHDSIVKGICYKDAGYWGLWIDNYVFDIQGGRFADGSNIRLWNYNGTDAQKWIVQENADGSVMFLSEDERLAMTRDLNGNIYLANLKEGDESQKWWLETDD